MKIKKLTVQIESDDSTRWFISWPDLGRKLALLLTSLLHVWTAGPQPRITVIPEEKFFVDPETAPPAPRPNLNWEHVARVDSLIKRGP